MRLIQRFAVVGVSAAPNFITASEFHFNKPIRIGQRLASEADDVGLASSQNRFGLCRK